MLSIIGFAFDIDKYGIFFKSKIEWKKKRHSESTSHSLFHFTAVFIYMGRGEEMREQMSILLLVATTRDTRNGDCGREKKKKKKKDS